MGRRRGPLAEWADARGETPTSQLTTLVVGSALTAVLRGLYPAPWVSHIVGSILSGLQVIVGAGALICGFRYLGVFWWANGQQRFGSRRG